MAYALFGGLTPFAVALLIARWPLAPAHDVAAPCALGLGVALSLARREPGGG